MTINIALVAGAGAQFFDDSGAPLSGGLIYTYLAGSTTPATSYTSRDGLTPNTNPIVLNAGGRPPAEIWLTGGTLYKYVIKTSAGSLIGTYDNLPAVNDPTTINSLITVTGTNTLTGAATPTLTGYTTGQQFTFVVANTNTAAVTLNIDGNGAKNIYKNGTQALTAGDLRVGKMAAVVYDGTQFQLLNPGSSGGSYAYAVIFGL